MSIASESQEEKHPSNKDNSQIKMRWATFCKGVALEPDTGETTLIGIMPAMSVTFYASDADLQKPLNIRIPCWVFAEFEYLHPTFEVKPLELEFAVSLEQGISRMSIEIYGDEEHPFAATNIRINLPQGLPVKPGIQVLKGEFFQNSQTVGIVELRINVIVRPISEFQGATDE